MGNDHKHFPFKSKDPATRAEADHVIRGIAAMVRNQIDRMNNLNISEQVTEEIYTTVISKLWEISMPLYDMSRFVKPSTYLHRCASRFIMEEFRRLSRYAKSKKRMDCISPDEIVNHPANDESIDVKVAAQAKDIISNPGYYLPPRLVDVLQAKLANPGMKMKDLATLLGYKRQSSLSMAMQRLREILVNIDIEEYVSTTTAPKSN